METLICDEISVVDIQGLLVVPSKAFFLCRYFDPEIGRFVDFKDKIPQGEVFYEHIQILSKE
jgi:hypothetical protein